MSKRIVLHSSGNSDDLADWMAEGANTMRAATSSREAPELVRMGGDGQFQTWGNQRLTNLATRWLEPVAP